MFKHNCCPGSGRGQGKGGGGGNMRIAIAVDEGFVSAHFGIYPNFLVLDIDGAGNIVRQELIENPGYTNHQPGLVPKFLQSIGVDCIIAGGMGPRAIMMLGISKDTTNFRGYWESRRCFKGIFKRNSQKWGGSL